MIWEIHTLHEGSLRELYKSSKKEDILIFDDCLYNIYKYSNRLDDIKGEKFLAVSPSLLREDSVVPQDKTANKSMGDKFLFKDRSGYMSLKEVKELLKRNFKIMGHGYFHDIGLSVSQGKKISNSEDWRKNYLRQSVKFPGVFKFLSVLAGPVCVEENGKIIKESDEDYFNRIHCEINRLRAWLEDNKMETSKFCYPFNQRSDILDEVLKVYGFYEFFGPNRKSI